MRFKITGKLTPQLLGVVIMKELMSRGLDSFSVVNIYVGSEEGIVEINCGKADKTTKTTSAPDLKAPERPKVDRPGRFGKKGKQPKKNIALTDQWEPKMGAVQPTNAIQMNADDLPF